METRELKEILKKVILQDAVIKFNSTPQVGEKFDMEKHNHANKMLNGMNNYIYNELVSKLEL